jgi:hypothetical protein
VCECTVEEVLESWCSHPEPIRIGGLFPNIRENGMIVLLEVSSGPRAAVAGVGDVAETDQQDQTRNVSSARLRYWDSSLEIGASVPATGRNYRREEQ